jgi:hypothetical protein
MGEVFDKGVVKRIEWIVPGDGNRPIRERLGTNSRFSMFLRIHAERLLPAATTVFSSMMLLAWLP